MKYEISEASRESIQSVQEGKVCWIHQENLDSAIPKAYNCLHTADVPCQECVGEVNHVINEISMHKINDGKQLTYSAPSSLHSQIINDGLAAFTRTAPHFYSISLKTRGKVNI